MILSQNWLVPFKKNLFILVSCKFQFLAYLECNRSYAWSFGNSYPDLSSVIWQTFKKPVKLKQVWVKHLLQFDQFLKLFQKSLQMKAHSTWLTLSGNTSITLIIQDLKDNITNPEDEDQIVLWKFCPECQTMVKLITCFHDSWIHESTIFF